MDEYHASDIEIKNKDLALKGITLLVGIGGFLLAFCTLSYQLSQAEKNAHERAVAAQKAEEKRLKDEAATRNRDITQKEKDFKLHFYNRQADVYFELCDVVSRIALADYPEQVLKDLERFKEIYVGRLVVVADPMVYDAVQAFNKALWELKLQTPIPKKILPLSNNICRVCRVSLSDAFPNIQALPDFQETIGSLKIPDKK